MTAALKTTEQSTDLFSLNKAVFAIHIAPRKGRLTLVMRKTYNVLLKLAWEEWSDTSEPKRRELLSEMAEKRPLTSKMQVSPAFTFSTKVGVILKALELERKNTKLIYSALDELRSCKVEWNMMLDGGETTFISGMLSEATIATGGRITWSYGLNLFEMLLQPTVYQAIDLKLQTEFTRYSSQALYENAVRYSKLRSTGWKSEHKWRELLSSDGSPTLETYSSWKSRTLKRALDELNAAARCPITLALEEKKGSDGQPRMLRFLISEKRHVALFHETPIPHDKKIVSQLKEYGFDAAEIADLLVRHDPDYVSGNLSYVTAQVAKGTVKSLKAYVIKTLKEDYRAPEVKSAEKEALLRKEQRLAEESKELEIAFSDFQAKRLREKFNALVPAEQRARFESFIGSGTVSQPKIIRLLEEEGLDVLQGQSANYRSAAGSFFTWLKSQHPALLTTPEETDKYVFAGMRRTKNSK